MGYDYEKYRRNEVISLGYNPDKLSKGQIDIMMEPNEAPENYACDGEISASQALRRWKSRLADEGFAPKEVRDLVKKIIG